jgi:hypothetical protein
MNSTILFLVCMVVLATAAPNGGLSNKNENSEFAQLTTEQRTCIAAAVKADTALLADLKNCLTTNGGLACVKAIPALASCFA